MRHLLEAFKFLCVHTRMLALIERSVQHRGDNTYYLTERFRLNESAAQSRLVVITNDDHFVVVGTRYDSCLTFEGNVESKRLIEIAEAVRAEEQKTIERMRRAEQKHSAREAVAAIDCVIADLSRARSLLLGVR